MSNKPTNIPGAKLEQLDILIQFITGNTKNLSKKQRSLLNIISFIDDQIRDNRTTEDIKQEIEFKYNKHVSSATLYRYIGYAKYVFGSSRTIDKRYELFRLFELSNKVISLASTATDYKYLGEHIVRHLKILAQIESEQSNLPEPPKVFQIIVQNLHGKPTIHDADKVHALPVAELRRIAENIQLQSLPLHPDEIPYTIDKPEDELDQADNSGTEA